MNIFFKRSTLYNPISPPLVLIFLISCVTHVNTWGQDPVQVVDTQCAFSVTAQLIAPTCAAGNDGSIRLQASATPDGTTVSYTWLNANVDVSTNVISNLSAGSYLVRVVSTACADTLTFSLLDPAPVTAPTIDTTFCGEGGVINLLRGISGGSGNYIVNATSISGTPINCATCQAQFFIDRTTIISMQVEDENGCTASRFIYVKVLPALEANIQTTDETCNQNGEIVINVTGGSGDYLYSINDGVFQTSNVFSDLAGDRNYDILVFDLEGCLTRVATNVTNNPSFAIPVITASESVSCFGAEDAVVMVDIESDRPIEIRLDNSLGPLDNGMFENVRAGQHIIRIREGDDCVNDYEIFIEEPEQISFTSTSSATTCQGGSNGEVQLQASGGNGNFVYSLDGENFSPNNIFRDLPEGNYLAYAKDQNECTETIAFSIEGPAFVPGFNINITPSCHGTPTGSILIVESGKLILGDFSFSLDSMNWQNDPFFGDIPSNDYTLYIRDDVLGCIYTFSLFVPESEDPNTALDITHVSCPGGTNGSVIVNIDSNLPPENYEYALNAQNFTSENRFNDLSSGGYIVYVRDTLGCVFETPFVINEPDEPVLEFELKEVSCYGGMDGELTVHVESEHGPFQYALNNGGFQEDSTFISLSSNAYVSLIRDANGCVFAENVNISEPDSISFGLTIVDETCGDGNGILVSLPQGGTPPYRFDWNTGDTTAIVTGLISGIYKLSVIDAANCNNQTNAFVDDLPGPIVLADQTNIDCNGMATGAIDLTVIGGTSPFRFVWSHGVYTEDIKELSAGGYVVTVVDVNSCSSTKSYTVVEPDPIELSYQSGQSGDYWFINLIVVGGVPPYEYTWSNGQTSEDIFNLEPGTYTVEVKDDQDCIRTIDIYVGTTSTNEPIWAETMRIFPIPAQDQITIEFGENQQVLQLSLLDLSGKILQQVSIQNQSKINWSLQDIPSGMYLFQFQQDGQSFYRKIVKMH